MTKEQFVALARGVYGHGFMSAVAGRNNVHRSTALRWAKGQIRLPDKAVKRLKEDAASRLAQLQRAVG